MKLNPKGDNIFNFTTITIASGSVLKLSEVKLHGPVYFLAQGDVTINGAIDLRGDDSPGPTTTAAEQIPAYAGSGGYSGGLGGIHADSNHQALPGNGPGGGAAGDINAASTYAAGGAFTTNRFLVPLTGGSGGGGTNDNSQYGAQGGAGAGALLIASSTKITVSGNGANVSSGVVNGEINARGGGGASRGCGGAGGAVRLVANSIIGADNQYILVNALNPGGACKTAPQGGLIRLETNNLKLRLEFSARSERFLVTFCAESPHRTAPRNHGLKHQWGCHQRKPIRFSRHDDQYRVARACRRQSDQSSHGCHCDTLPALRHPGEPSDSGGSCRYDASVNGDCQCYVPSRC